MEERDVWLRGAIAGGWQRSQVEESDRYLRRAVSGRGEQSLVEGSDCWWPGRMLVERSDLR